MTDEQEQQLLYGFFAPEAESPPRDPAFVSSCDCALCVNFRARRPGWPGTVRP